MGNSSSVELSGYHASELGSSSVESLVWGKGDLVLYSKSNKTESEIDELPGLQGATSLSVVLPVQFLFNRI